jgi:radical SAM-linked protein
MERLLIKFTKTNEAKFISHLDTLRTIQRAIRRADIPISYSKGFNPHASISVAAPLSLGLSSIAEYVDLDLDESVEIEIVKSKLNDALPRGMRILDAVAIKEKMPPSMAAVEGAKYRISLKHNLNKESLESTIKSIMDSEEIMRLKKTKSGEKMVNVRPLIKEIKLIDYKQETCDMECLLLAGSKGTVSPDIVSDLLKDSSKNGIYGYPDILREELYSIRDDKWIDLLTYFSRK